MTAQLQNVKAMAQLSPYLTFNGNCQEAFDFYKSVFGGEYATVMTYGQVPKNIPDTPQSSPDKLIHISLPISAETILMGCDMPDAFGSAVFGNNFSISIAAASADEADRLFTGLSKDGKINMPMADSFWGAYFGMFTDKFGISWMVSFDKSRQ